MLGKIHPIAVESVGKTRRQLDDGGRRKVLGSGRIHFANTTKSECHTGYPARKRHSRSSPPILAAAMASKDGTRTPAKACLDDYKVTFSHFISIISSSCHSSTRKISYRGRIPWNQPMVLYWYARSIAEISNRVLPSMFYNRGLGTMPKTSHLRRTILTHSCDR